MSSKTDARSSRESRDAETIFPPSDPSTVEPLAAFLNVHDKGARLVAPNGVTTEIPGQVLKVLRDVVEAMSQGRAITVAPVSLRLTTTQAAEMIGVSRPTLIKLLEDGEIPYEQPRRHRLLRLDDVLAFQEGRRQRNAARLDDLTRQAVADGLYAASADVYREALDEARSATS